MWLYEGKEFAEIPDQVVGFVYLITNTINGKQYVGKKLFTKAGYKQVKGKQKKIRKESDWLTYYGSNKKLQEDVISHGSEYFTREILHLCETRGQCSYLEAKEQMGRDVLMFPNQWYNEQVRCRVHRSHLKLKK